MIIKFSDKLSIKLTIFIIGVKGRNILLKPEEGHGITWNTTTSVVDSGPWERCSAWCCITHVTLKEKEDEEEDGQ